MGHANLMGGNRLEDVIVVKGLKLQKMSFVPADNAPLNKDMPTYIEMNPAGAVDVLMPAVTADMAGLMFFLSNISSSTITLKTSGDAAFTTAIVLAAGENCWVVCTGSSTAALGWRGTATASSA
jgi:hypothetical protein